MRGLITVKLANEQVNYRTKFLYKNCHFSERCSSSRSKSLKKKKGGGEAGEEKGRGQMPFPAFFFLFQDSSLVFAPLSSKACCLRLRGNSRINELLLFFQTTLPPPHISSLRLFFPLSFPSLRRLHQTPLTPCFLPTLLLAGFHPYTSPEPFGRLQIFIFFFYLFATTM